MVLLSTFFHCIQVEVVPTYLMPESVFLALGDIDRPSRTRVTFRLSVGVRWCLGEWRLTTSIGWWVGVLDAELPLVEPNEDLHGHKKLRNVEMTE